MEEKKLMAERPIKKKAPLKRKKSPVKTGITKGTSQKHEKQLIREVLGSKIDRMQKVVHTKYEDREICGKMLLLTKNMVSHEDRVRVEAMVHEKFDLERIKARKIEVEYGEEED